MAYSYSKMSVEPDRNKSVLNNKTSESSLFLDSENTGSEIIISRHVSGMSGFSAVENHDDHCIYGFMTTLAAGAKERSCKIVKTRRPA